MYCQKSLSKIFRGTLPALAILLLLVTGCSKPRNRYHEQPIARVHNYYLYPADLEGLVPEGTISADSIQIVKTFIDQWTRKRVLLKQAEFNLSARQQDVSRMLEDYRATLLIFEYEKEYLVQRMDTTVSRGEIESYYLEHLNNFRLRDPIIKGVYFRIRSNAPKLNEIRNTLRSTRSSEYTRMSVMIGESADLIDSFEDRWVSFSLLNQQIPGYLENPDEFLKRNLFLEVSDQNLIHFVKILEYKLPGEVAPLPYIQDQVKDIILNRRKVEFLKELESSIYNQAVLQNQIEIYDYVR